MPSVTAIKRISQNYGSTVELTRVGVTNPGSPLSPTAGHFGEDSVIKFFLHKKIKRVDEREGKIYIKVSLFSDDVVNGFGAATAAPARGSISAKNLQKKKKPQESERIDKLIAVRPHTPIADVTALALDKFHLLNGIVDGDEDMEQRRRAKGDKEQRLIKYALNVAVGSATAERSLNPQDSIISAFQGPTPPVKSSRNSGSDIASVTSGSSTASAPHADETYFILRRTDKHKDAEYAKQQQARPAVPKRLDSISSTEQDLKRAISPPLGTTPRAPVSYQLHPNSNPGRTSLERPTPMRKDTAGFHEAPSSGMSEDAMGLDGRPMRRSQILRMLNVDDITATEEAGRTVSPPPTSLRSAKRFSPDKLDGRLSSGSNGGDQQDRLEGDDLPEVSVPRRPANEVLSKLDEALHGLEHEKQEHAALLEAKLNDFHNSGSSGNRRNSGPPKQLTPQQMRHQRMLQEQERAESPLLLQGSINALRNEEDGVDIVLPGKTGLLRSSRMFDSRVRYSFVAPDGTEKEISKIVEEFLGDMDGNERQDEENTTDLASTLSSPPRSDPASPTPVEEASVVKKADKKESKKRGLGKKKKADILESYVDQATGPSMRIETLERLEKVLKRVKDGDKKKEKKDKEDKKDGKKSSSKPSKSSSLSSKGPAKIPSQERISVSADPAPLTRQGSQDSLGGGQTRTESSNTQASDLRKTTDSPMSMSKPTRRSPAPSPSPSFDRSSSSTPTSGMTESTRGTSVRSASASPNPHDSWAFSDDFGLDELMVLVRGGITFLEAKEKKKDGWEDENGNPIPQSGNVSASSSAPMSPITPTAVSASPVPGMSREGGKEGRDKDVEVRQDVKEVYRESLSSLDDLEKELERIMSDTIKAF
ncbi:hypothetical protein BC936DRAFT_140394 [Jimgerdemannia flammicorona]|nr:hypothetical protein BC936DRAFT_140394 [Jimgerdemannia flammicorona]